MCEVKQKTSCDFLPLLIRVLCSAVSCCIAPEANYSDGMKPSKPCFNSGVFYYSCISALLLFLSLFLSFFLSLTRLVAVRTGMCAEGEL